MMVNNCRYWLVAAEHLLTINYTTRGLRNQGDWQLRLQVSQAIRAVAGNPFETVVVCSFCHREDTRQSVRRACIENNVFTGTLITDKPTGPLRKLTCILAVVDSELLRNHRVYHLDDVLKDAAV